MTAAVLTEDPERSRFESRPHLSHSRINRYLTCPEQYRLYYLERLRPRLPSAALVFGKVVHEALAGFFRAGEDPETEFLKAWQEVKQLDLTYTKRDSWEKLKDTGSTLLRKFVIEEAPRIERVEASEKAFELVVSTLELPYVGIIDLVGAVSGKRTVVDFKTASSGYEDHEVALSDQLTAYQMAEPEAEQAALCVLVKTKEPQIQWHLSSRTSEALVEYLTKAGHIAQEIKAGHFYKRPGKWCSWCDFLPVCLGDDRTVRDTLINVP